MKKIYIAGPMTGKPDLNFKAFDEAAFYFRKKGWEVVNPADLDREQGFDLRARADWSDFRPSQERRRSFARRDLKQLIECDAIAMLEGWRDSLGAQAEYALAVWCGLEVRDYMPIREKKVYINIDEDGTLEIFDTRKEAEGYASDDREACIELDLTYRKGDGIDG